MKTVEKDIFKGIEDGECDGIVHCCNLYHSFGAGIAKVVKEKFPYAFAADCATVYGDTRKLGRFSMSNQCVDGFLYVDVYNLYGQRGIGNNGDPAKRNALYDKIYDGLRLIFQNIIKHHGSVAKYTLAVPHGMCCGLAGGNWKIVSAILESLEEEFENIDVRVYKLPS